MSEGEAKGFGVSFSPFHQEPQHLGQLLWAQHTMQPCSNVRIVTGQQLIGTLTIQGHRYAFLSHIEKLGTENRCWHSGRAHPVPL